MSSVTERDMPAPASGRVGAARDAKAPMATGLGDLAKLAIFAAVVLTMPWWLVAIGGYEALATKIVIWALFAVGFDILLGFTGYLSFGHAFFFGGAAYLTGLVLRDYTSDIIPAFIVAVLGTIVFALALGFLTLKRSGIYFSILTLAFGQMLHAAVLSIFGAYTGGDNGMTGLQSPTLLGVHMSDDVLFDLPLVFWFAAIFLIIGYAVARQIKNSPFGTMLRSIKENPMRLEYTGVNVWAYKMAAFTISAVYAGVAGFLMVVYEPYVATEFTNWTTSGHVVIMSVIGGVGTLVGPMIGAAFMEYFANVVQAFPAIGQEWRLILGLIFMGVVIFLPGGFMQIGSIVWKQTGGRVRQRRHNVPDMEPDNVRSAQMSGRGQP